MSDTTDTMEDFVRFEVRLPLSIRDRIKEAAAADRRSMHSYILKCIDCCLDCEVGLNGVKPMVRGGGGAPDKQTPPSPLSPFDTF